MPATPQLESQPHKKMASPGVLARNAAANLSQRGVAWIILLLLPPLLVRTLDKPSYAIWMLLLQLGAYITQLDVSIQSSTMHFVARGQGLRDDNYVSDLLSSAGAVLLGASALAALFTLAVSWRFSSLFRNVPQSLMGQAAAALMLVGLSLCIAQPFSILAGYFKGRQRGEVAAAASAAGKVGGAIGVAWAAYHRQGLVVMAAWMAAGNLLVPVVYLLAWAKWGAPRLLRFSRVSLHAIGDFSSFWIGRLATQFCAIVITGLDLPIVAAFDFPSAGYYAVATTLSNTLLVPQTAISSALLPAISTLSAYATPEQLGDAAIKVTRGSLSILILLSLPLLFGMRFFLRLWVGSQYSEHAYLFGIVLVCAFFVRECMGSFVLVCVSGGQQQRTLISAICEAAVNLVFSLILVHRMGALGVAVGTLIGALVGVVIHATVSMRLVDAVKVNRRALFLTGIARPVLCALPAVGFLALSMWWAGSVYTRAAALLLGEGIAALVLFFGSFNSTERSRIISLAKRFFGAALARRDTGPVESL